MGRIERSIGAALLAGAVLTGVSGCGGHASASSDAKAASKATAGAHPSAKPSPTHPAGPAMPLESIAPEDGATVGVAMPISIEFSHAVASSARAEIERHLKVTTSTPLTGAWHWFADDDGQYTRVDWRPEKMWPSGTKVTLNADLDGVGDGNGRYGTRTYRHSFTIGPDFEAKVDVPGHSMKVTRNGSVVRTIPIDAGSADFPSWDGTMAVMDKEREVRMTSCSVGIACDKSNPNFYDTTLPWDVQLTTSGTYIHYSTGDPDPGSGEGSHGCVHLSWNDAEWFYGQVKQGDPVTITGSPRGAVHGDNGYGAFTLSWSQWLQGSATGAQRTSAG
ncbi:L,D-transpeptidase [Streptomyces orinoci]|uniref:L,D-transpeptidase n=1 Tax=Streptomyces orinoci TaxID=67339 RepID=A0ABV3K3H9_STRON|nr:L,D-transpeptidase [Streptomyces orinoci]